MMFKKAQVVMLPTNEKSNLILIGSWKRLHRDEHSNITKLAKDESFQHLYIVSDEEIKEGDWYLADERISKTELKPIWVVTHCDTITNGWLESNSNPGQGDNPNWSKKIIATTDLLLMSDKFSSAIPIYLPQPSQSFIDKYITEYNKGNIITDIMVEYEEIKAPFEDENNPADITFKKVVLKVNPKDNTITIKRIKDSWTREEVIQLIRDFDISLDENDGYGGSNYRTVWIKNNL